MVAQARHGGRSATAISAVIARETERLTIGWGIISPFTRHPIEVAMDARVTQEAAGPGRFRLGFGASRIFMKEIGAEEVKPLNPARDSVRIVRGVLGGEPFDYDGPRSARTFPALTPDAQTPRGGVPIYIAGTGPRMQEYAGEEADGLLTASITTPAFVRYSRENMARGAAKTGRDPADDRPRLHDRRVDRPRPRPRTRGRSRDRRHVPREQGAEHPGLGRRAARARRALAGADRPDRGRDGARRPARGGGGGQRRDPRPLHADRRHARRTASPRSRPTARPAAPTSCSSCGARTASARSSCSPPRSCPTSRDEHRSRARAAPRRRGPPRRHRTLVRRHLEPDRVGARDGRVHARHARRRWASRSAGRRSRTAGPTSSAGSRARAAGRA